MVIILQLYVYDYEVHNLSSKKEVKYIFVKKSDCNKIYIIIS